MKAKIVIPSFLAIAIGSVQTICAAETKQKIYWQYDPQNPEKLGVELNNLDGYAEQKNSDAIAQLCTKLNEWHKKGCPGDYLYGAITNQILELYHTKIKERSAHIPILMPLFYEVGVSLFRSIKAAISEADVPLIQDVQVALDMVSQRPDLIRTELKQSTEDEIKELWNFIPYHTQKKLIAEANNYLAKLENNYAKEQRPKTKYYHNKIFNMYSTVNFHRPKGRGLAEEYIKIDAFPELFGSIGSIINFV